MKLHLKNRRLIKLNVLFSLLIIILYSCSINKDNVLKTNRTNIHITINGQYKKWRIDPDVNPDRLFVYCEHRKNIVTYNSTIDSLSFFVRSNDTVRIKVLLNNETANTEIIGLKDLPNRYTVNEKLFNLSQFWSEVKYNFMNYDKICYQWDSIYLSTITEVINSKNDYEYYQILKKFAASLNDGHTAIYSNGQFSVYCDYAPVGLVYLNNKIYILYFRETLSSQLEVGAEVIEIEGIPVNKYLEDMVLPYISASTAYSKFSIAASLIPYGFKNKPLKLKFISPKNGRIREAVIKRDGEMTRYNKNGSEKYKRIGVTKARNNDVVFSFDRDSIAVLKVSVFSPEESIIDQFNNLIPKIALAKGLIIDIRDNGGGSTEVAEEILKHIAEGKCFLGLAGETKINNAVHKALGSGYTKYSNSYNLIEYKNELSDTIHIDDTIVRFNFPIAVLINENTASAAEDFLIMMYNLPNRPVIIGNETAGSTGLPLVINGLPGGGYARICTRRCIYPQTNKPFVNQGIIPDIRIIPTIHDVIQGNDVVMDKAHEYIMGKLEKQ